MLPVCLSSSCLASYLGNVHKGEISQYQRILYGHSYDTDRDTGVDEDGDRGITAEKR